MDEMDKKRLIKELQGLREKLKESMGHFKKLRREIRLSVKRLERKNKLPLDVEQEMNKVDLMILRSFLEAYLSLLDRAREDIRVGLDELGQQIKEEVAYGSGTSDSEIE